MQTGDPLHCWHTAFGKKGREKPTKRCFSPNSVCIINEKYYRKITNVKKKKKTGVLRKHFYYITVKNKIEGKEKENWKGGGRGRGCSPMGRLIASVGEQKFRQTTSGTHSSAGRADCLPRGKPPCIASMGNNFAVSNSPWRGLTRRLRRGLGLAVPRGALSLRVAIRRGAGGERKAPCLRQQEITLP